MSLYFLQTDHMEYFYDLNAPEEHGIIVVNLSENLLAFVD